MATSKLSERPKGQWWQSIEPMVEVAYDKVHGLGAAASSSCR